MPQEVRPGERIRIVAWLEDEAGEPVGGGDIAISQPTSFGHISLYTVTTNARGMARAVHREAREGDFPLQFSFAGTEAYEAAETTVTLSVRASADEAGTAVGIKPDANLLEAFQALGPPLRWSVLLLVAGVWLSYAWVASRLILIRRDET